MAFMMMKIEPARRTTPARRAAKREARRKPKVYLGVDFLWAALVER